MPKKPVIAVIGSLNVDMVTRTPRIPAAGETFTVDSFSTGYGGKGANQAVAAARLSRTKGSMFSPAIESNLSVTGDVDVRMIGAVGDDVFGSGCVRSLRGDGVNVEGVQTMKGSTGVANIIVDSKTGENRIMVSTGANHGLEKGVDLVPDDADVVVLQLEIPPEVVWHNIKLAKSKGKRVIFNPAPAIVVPDEVYDGLDDLIMNETEAAILNGTPDHEFKREELPDVAKKFRAKGVQNVIITLGAEGVFWADGWSEKGAHIPANKVAVVDTTAAGDTFVGAYAVGLQRHGSGHAITEAVAWARNAAGLTIQKEGAQISIPWKDELEAAYSSTA